MSTVKKCKICGKPFKGEGDVGPTCAEHEGLIGKYYVNMSGTPQTDEYVSLVELCNLAEEFGKSRYWMVKLTGGDGGVFPPHFPEFTIYIFNGRKFCKRTAVPTMQELAKKKP